MVIITKKLQLNHSQHLFNLELKSSLPFLVSPLGRIIHTIGQSMGYFHAKQCVVWKDGQCHTSSHSPLFSQFRLKTRRPWILFLLTPHNIDSFVCMLLMF